MVDVEKIKQGISEMYKCPRCLRQEWVVFQDENCRNGDATKDFIMLCICGVKGVVSWYSYPEIALLDSTFPNERARRN